MSKSKKTQQSQANVNAQAEAQAKADAEVQMAAQAKTDEEGFVTVIMLQSMIGPEIDWPAGSEQTFEASKAQRLIDAAAVKLK